MPLGGGVRARTDRPPSAASVIHARLRNEITSLRRKPGEPLAEKAITEAYGVSRTPVREAILRLANEGLVDIFPQSGTFVARIPQRALPEAIVIRMALEEKSARLAAERATRSQLMRVQAIVEQLRESEAGGNREAFHQADEHFHAAIAEMAGYPGIWALVQQVKVQVDRYRRLTLPQEGRMQRIIEEHQAILDAIGAHDPDRAAALMNAHLGALIASLDDIRGVNPDYFAESGHGA
ncbi:MAG TPA: GntR family transcriptional regulator [Devosia sp.]|nr:GntR family transcriptional regulator [Devosia sp.]